VRGIRILGSSLLAHRFIAASSGAVRVGEGLTARKEYEDVRYQIREGDTLEAIASSFGVAEEAVREINDPWITQPDEFRAGKALEIPETLRDVRTALQRLDLRDLKIGASEVFEQVEQAEPQEKSELTK